MQFNLVIALTLASFFSCITMASEQKPHLVYGVPHDPPYTILKDGGYSGRDIELMNIIESRLNIDVQHTACDWIRCLELLKIGKIDIMTSVSRIPEREHFIDFVTPAYSTEYVTFWVRKGQAHNLNDYSDLMQLTVGKENGASYYRKVEQDPNIEIYETTEFSTLVNMLASGRIDAIMGSDLVLERLITATKHANALEEANFRHESLPSYIGLSKNSTRAIALQKEVQQLMKSMKRNGELDYFLKWQPNK